MLNKNICKTCFRNNSTFQWGKNHEEMWNKNIVPCPTNITLYKYAYVDDKNNPPQHCPYALEHVMI